MKKYLVIVMSVLSFLSYSQEINEEKQWTLEDCISYAKDKSITVKSVELTLKEAQVTYEKSKGMRLPNLIGSVSQTFTNGNTIDPITSNYVSQEINATSPYLSSSVTLYQGKILNNQIKQNELYVSQNALYVQEAKNSVSLSITEAYLQALYNKDAIVIAQTNLATSEQQMKFAKARLDAGTVAMQDYTDAVSQAATNKYNLVVAKNSYAQQMITLKQLLELGPEDQFEIASLETQNTVITSVPDKLTVYNLAMENMPEIKAATVSKAASEKGLDIAKGAYLPTVSLTGSLGSGYTSVQTSDFLSQMDLNFNQKLAVTLSVPIFNRNQTKGNVQLAKIDIEKSGLEAQTAKKELYQKIETSWQNATASVEQLEASKMASDAAAESYKLAQKKYELNALSTTDLVVSQNTYTNAEQTYIQSKYLNILYFQLLQFYQGNEIKL